MIDLSSLDTVAGANAGVDVQLRHPATGDDLGITIHVLGRDSDTFKAVETRQLTQRMERVRRSGRNTNAFTPEQANEDAIELLASSTTGWSDNFVVDGKPMPFSVAAAEQIYARFPWIREQVDQAVGDRANFTKPLSAASSNTPVINSAST